MRTIVCDIGNSGELHKLYQEYCRDSGQPLPNVDFWLYNFRNPNFFCVLAKHGKKGVGFVMGEIKPYYEIKRSQLEVVFVRRGFRKMKFLRSLIESSVAHLKKSGAAVVSYNRIKNKERKL
jgi:predicted HAD superfamily hydrolase